MSSIDPMAVVLDRLDAHRRQGKTTILQQLRGPDLMAQYAEILHLRARITNLLTKRKKRARLHS